MAANKIPLFTLERQNAEFADEICEAFARVLCSGVFIGGPEVRGFEGEFSRWVGAKHGVGVASGFDALKIGLWALGIGRGDEVITCASGCPATPLAIAASGATPVFVDCDDHCLIDTAEIERAITHKTRAIMPVHLYGRPVNMTKIMSIARKKRLFVVEDCAQAHGTEWNGAKVGTFGDLSCFSFYPTKNLGALGDAGLAVTSSARLAGRLRQIANYGEVERFDSRIPGVNSRMDPVQAAILRAKLKKLDSHLKTRRQIAKLYSTALRHTGLVLPSEPAQGKHSYHLYVIQTSKRARLQKALDKAGIGHNVHYPIPLHLLGAFKGLGYKRGDFPNAERLAKRILSLPMFPELTEAEVSCIAKEVSNVKD